MEELFDAHFHIIDYAFPLLTSNQYRPPEFTVNDYKARTAKLNVTGGTVVSGSFQGVDQTYLKAALAALGPNFFGVTQLPISATDNEIMELNSIGVRAIRFNVERGGSEDINHLKNMALRIYEIAGWHVELYIDSTKLEALSTTLLALPKVSIDHLGISKAGFKDLLKLVENGVKVKASGFGRVDFDVKQALKDIATANPDALMFGTDLPSTRAPRPFQISDISLIMDLFDEKMANKILNSNAAEFYRHQ